MRKRKFTKRYYLVIAFVILFLGIGVIFRSSLIPKSRQSRAKAIFAIENNKLHKPLQAFGVKEDQSVDSCQQIIIAVRKNEPNLHGQECIRSVGGYVYINNDTDKERVVTAAQQLNKDLKENGWQPEGGHADIAYWVNYLAENREILSAKAETAPFFQNSLNKQIDKQTSCWFNAFSSVEESSPVGIRINFSCTYNESK